MSKFKKYRLKIEICCKQTRKEFELQYKTLAYQKFENTFFNMLKVHHEIKNSLYWERLLRKFHF